jgi:hypothetical protein
MLRVGVAGAAVAIAASTDEANDGAVRVACHDRCVKAGPTYADLAGVTTAVHRQGGQRTEPHLVTEQILGAPLTEQELMCLQIEQNGFGCPSCPNEPPSRSLDGGSSSG